ncbi:SET and MYND domain containing, arthropod-specific, member 2 isoform X2 [Lycorma delicatula]|uniref:SET and MYND domain containing, arthropod-specific, member 2 isoform X2 n=1 Tax=Lycorma delicatula TaxID=130591 RepID=UPI003F518C71
MVLGKCAVCAEEAHQQCAGCKTVFYCGRDHQKTHWKQCHKTECCCYKITENERLGRYLIASRDIKAGEIIIKEPPLVVGPKVASLPTCLGCHKLLKPTSPDEETLVDYYKCSGCGWPMCAPRCESSSHHQQECDLMKKCGYSSTISYDGTVHLESAYCTILPLRCLLLEPSKLKKLLELQSHLEARIKTPLYQVLKKNLVGFIKKILHLEQYNEETILKIAAILDTNAFEIRRTLGNIKIRGIYPKVAMMSHDCKPNTKHTYDGDNFIITVSAIANIKKDEIISTTYTQTLWGTLSRRSHLNEFKCFLCTCSRCSDPTELELYVGGILCSKCKGKMISIDPLDNSSKWQCKVCSHSIPARQIIAGNESLRQELEAARPSGINGLEYFLNKYLCDGSILHSTNTHILQAKHALSQLYSNSLPSLTDGQLQKQIHFCKDLLFVANKLEPGLSRFRGLLLYDLQAAKLVEVKRKYENGGISQEKAQKMAERKSSLIAKSVQTHAGRAKEKVISKN